MSEKISPLINHKELIALRDKKNLVLIDVRTGADARERYLSKHLAGAFFADLNVDLADIKADAKDGGRHPLPSPARFSKVLQKCGISPESCVVAYDDKQGANAAARFWWMLKAAGHEKVCVLDGGFEAAIAAGFATSSGEEIERDTVEYKFEKWSLPVADIEDVDAARTDENFLVIDVREKNRFDGKTEPIDLIAGHIPGAENIPFAENLDARGFFLAPEKLRAKYTEALKGKPPQNVIVHCGSGVTACHTLLAFDRAGLEIPRLYVGSWSEWSRNDRPIAVENSKD